MKLGETHLSDESPAGAFIGNLLIGQEDIVDRALSVEAVFCLPIEQRPINNLTLCRALSKEASHAFMEGDDPEERSMVFRRGLGWAYAVGRQAVGSRTLPQLLESPDGRTLSPDERFQSIMTGSLKMVKNYNITATIAQKCSLYVDASGSFNKLSHFSVLAGLYLIDNGERSRRRRAVQSEQRKRLQYEKETFRKISDAQVLADFTAIALNLTFDPAFDPRPY